MNQSGRRIFRNSLVNLAGMALPLIGAVVSIPLLVRYFGAERFGVLTFAWMAVGYFSLWDFGLGRAITKMIAERTGEGSEAEAARIAWTGTLLLGLGALASAAILAPAVGSLVGIFDLPPEIRRESTMVAYLLVASLPLVVVATGLRAVLEGVHHFGAVNAVRIPLGLLTFLGPLLVIPISGGLVAATAILLAGRGAGALAFLLLCLRDLPAMRVPPRLRREYVRPLLGFGGWIAVSNMLSPLMVQFDRVIVGAVISMTAVTYYVTPFEAVTRLWVIPIAVVGVLFPAFASAYPTSRDSLIPLAERARRAVLVIMFPLCLLVVLGAHEGLRLWIGPDFARESTRVAQFLALGVFINSSGQIPYTLLQGAGRPDLTAKLHLVQIPIYLTLLWFLIPRMGIAGVALASTLRLTLDTSTAFYFAKRCIVPEWRLRPVLIEGGVSVGILVLAIVTYPLVHGGWVWPVAIAAFAWVAWIYLLDEQQRSMLRSVGRLRERSRSA